jgi:hypothetical protein
MNKALMGLFGLVAAELLGQGIPFGQEFQVNTFSEYEQMDPSVISLLGGGFVVSWTSMRNEGWGEQIYGQLFNESGAMSGKEFKINTKTSSCFRSAMASLHLGGFVACWCASNGLVGPDGLTRYDVYGQRFDDFGTKIGEEFQVNTPTQRNQMYPSVVALQNNGFIICWQSSDRNSSDDGIYGQIFKASGEKSGSEFRISTSSHSSFLPSVTSSADGSFFVCWTGYTAGVQGRECFCQRFDSTGMKLGGERQVAEGVDYSESRQYVSLFAKNKIVVCWDGFNEHHKSVAGQVLNQSGEKLGNLFLVSMNSMDCHFGSVISLQNGGFMVCWESMVTDENKAGVYAQLYDSTAERIGQAFLISNYFQRTSDYDYLSISKLFDGGVIACWNTEKQQGYGWDVHAKRFPADPQNHTLIPFSVITPLNDSSINTIHPLLQWSQSTNQIVCYPWELHYKILVADNPYFSSPQIFEQDQDTTLTLQNLSPGTTYFWKVLAKNIAGDSLWSSNTNAFFVSRDATDDVKEDKQNQPNQFVLHQNYPNPFNPETTIRFDLPQAGLIEIAIYNIAGKLVKTLASESKSAGSFSVVWGGRDSSGNMMSSGIYLCRMNIRTADGKTFVQMVKMGLVK